MPGFPHMDETAFPHVGNVDVYKFRNEFDYSRYDDAQMHIMLCSVPWDMGEAHIGARTISGIGNVVWFETEEKRDAWFDAIPDGECFRFTTKFKELHRDNMISVPVPFDVASNFNYLVVEYEPFANADSLVEYESLNGLSKWYWFIREVEFVSPNTTRLHLMSDAWQTFMYRIDITGMILERGHAPLFDVDADTYLSNPIDNNAGLLAEDVNYGAEPVRVANSAVHVFNDSTLACIVTSAIPTGDWGSKSAGSWRVPTSAFYTVDGVPGYKIFALEAYSLNTFLGYMEQLCPQFAQTVKGVFFAPAELINRGASFTFCNMTCWSVGTSNKVIEFLDLEKSQFGYPEKYADLAKLYTWPYSCLEIVDENGNTQLVRIENTDGSLEISAALSLAFPAISLQAHVLGIGGVNSLLAFTNIDGRSLTIGGKWYETLHSWDVPIFGIIQNPGVYNDYDTHFDRAQQATALSNTYDSDIESANTAKANADANAATVIANSSMQVMASNALTSAGNTMATADTQTGQTLNTSTTGNAIDYTNTSKNNEIELKNATAAASQASNAVNSAVGSFASAMSGNYPGAVTGIISGLAQAAVINATNEAGVNYTESQAAASNQNNHFNAIDTNLAAAAMNEHAITAANSRLEATNNLTTGTAANNAATISENAQRSRDTAANNAERSRNTAQSAIDNSVKQARLNVPQEFGIISNTGQATTKPMALMCNILKQSRNAIEMAGDEFLRYGYYFNKQWDFDGNWNIGKHFTYWKLADFWVHGLNIPDMYVDKLRFFLYGGVTIWRKPEDIGNITIYENM